MALGNSDQTSRGLTHCPHVDRLLISSSLLPECPVNNGVDKGIELCCGSIPCPQNYVRRIMSAELQSRSRFDTLSE
jgi:hypothetical protein